MPRTLRLEAAKPSEVTRAVRDLLVQRGARMDEQTPARTVFEGLATPGGFTRGGYVGVYQALGEPDATVHLEAWAVGPRQAWWVTVALVLLAAVGLVAASPGSAAWFVAGLALWAWLALAGVGYYLTFAGSRALEADLEAALQQTLRARWTVLDEAQQLERSIREKLEGEVKAREVAQRPPPSRAPRVGRGRTAAGAEPAGRDPARRGQRGLFRRRKG